MKITRTYTDIYERIILASPLCFKIINKRLTKIEISPENKEEKLYNMLHVCKNLVRNITTHIQKKENKRKKKKRITTWNNQNADQLSIKKAINNKNNSSI